MIHAMLAAVEVAYGGLRRGCRLGGLRMGGLRRGCSLLGLRAALYLVLTP